jgi:PAS domain S-box-containing protein
VADIGYFTAVPLAIAGLVSFPGVVRRGFARARQLLDALMIAASVLFASWALVLGPTFRSDHGSLLKQVLSVAYPASDVAIVSLALTVALAAQRYDRAAIWLVMAGMVGFALSDSGFAYFTTLNNYGIGNVLDTGWVLGYFLIALGPLRAPRAAPGLAAGEAVERVTLTSTLVPYAAVGLAASVVLGRFAEGHSFGVFLPLDGLFLVMALTARHVLTLVDNVKLNHRLLVRVERGSEELRSRQEALAESEERFHSIFEQAPLGILRLDTDGRIVDANRALCELVGRTPEELDGYPRTSLFDDPVEGPPVPGHAAGQRSDNLIDGPRSSQHRVRRPDGALRVVQVNDVVVQDKQGGSHTLVATVEDITDGLRLAEELRRAQQMEALGQLAAGIAHEINTPTQFISDNLVFLANIWGPVAELLGASRSAAASLRDGAAPQDVAALLEQTCEEADFDFVRAEVPTALSQSQEGVERVATIVRAFKLFGRPDDDHPELADIGHLVTNTITVAHNQLKSVADVSTDYGPMPEVMCFPGAISQVVLNLLVNAAYAVRQVGDATGARGRIEVRTWADESDAFISVSDTGPGIPPNVLPRIFQPFFTTKPFGQGTGQGLAMAWVTIVDRHRGHIEVTTSEAGTTFTLRLPVGRRREETAVLTGTSVEGAGG